MILYCYISHHKKILEDSQAIQEIMASINYNHYKIFYCGENLHIKNKTIVHLGCDDFYEGLPNKIHNICKYIITSPLQNYYTHICKIDATNNLQNVFPLIETQDYYGYILHAENLPEYRRKYHYGRCSEGNFWNEKRYDGEFVPYCAGGFGYVLSLKSVECIANNPNDPNNDIYEDVYVGQQLLRCGISPYHVDTRSYLRS